MAEAYSEQPHVFYVYSDLEDLMPRFFELLEKDLVSLDTAISANDYESIMRASHKIKGAVGSYGFKSIAKAMEEIEELAESKDLQGIIGIRQWVESILRKKEIHYVEDED